MTVLKYLNREIDYNSIHSETTTFSGFEMNTYYTSKLHTGYVVQSHVFKLNIWYMKKKIIINDFKDCGLKPNIYVKFLLYC